MITALLVDNSVGASSQIELCLIMIRCYQNIIYGDGRIFFLEKISSFTRSFPWLVELIDKPGVGEYQSKKVIDIRGEGGVEKFLPDFRMVDGTRQMYLLF